MGSILAGLETKGIEGLEIEDAESFRHVALFSDLKEVLARAAYPFLVPRSEGAISWDRALFLNLAFWDEAHAGDVLVEPRIDADVVMHVAWHQLAAAHLEPSPEAQLLGEAIASAFDLYLVGRLLGHAPESSFLATQVPLMSEAAASAGLEENAFEAMIASVAADPDQAFEDLRSLLYEVSTELLGCRGAERALAVLEAHDESRFAPLLHHYELSTWIANARVAAKHGEAGSGADGAAEPGRASASDVHAHLKKAKSSVDWLDRNWVSPLVSEPGRASVVKA